MASEKEFLKRCKDEPQFFCEKVLGVFPWAKQIEIMNSVRDNPNTIVVSANAQGKSWVSAAIVLWFLLTHKGSLVATTAPTYRQIMSVLWAEITKMYYGARIPLGGELTSGKLMVNEKEKWFAIGIPASEEVRFQGLHAEDILVIFDEAAGVPPEIYTAASGNLTSDNSRWLLIGNPTSPSGMFYDYSKNPNWHKITLNALESPAITEPEKYPFLATKKWCMERAQEWGTSSPMYQARVLGEFPVEGDDTLIPMSWVDQAVKRYMEKNNKDLLVSEHAYLGVDVARMGGDKTVCTTYQPNKVFPQKKAQGKDLPTVKHLVSQEAIEAGKRLMQITIDSTGLGGGPSGDLRVMGYPVLEFNFAQKANNKRFFRRLKDEAAWNLREVFRAGEIAIPPDDELISQLCAMKYTADQDTGLIEVESKEEQRSRGLKSPDCFWSLVLAVWGSKRVRVSPSIRPTAYREQKFNNKETKWY
jgi:phage terminase large subunit